jgi:hypothetical protein
MSEPARDLRREALLMRAGSEKASNQAKNEKKDGKPKWDTESLYFDKDGCLFVKNPELAKEIHSVMKAWGNRLRMYTWAASKREAMEIYGDDGKSGGSGTSEAGHPVNMMCPCAPEG